MSIRALQRLAASGVDDASPERIRELQRFALLGLQDADADARCAPPRTATEAADAPTDAAAPPPTTGGVTKYIYLSRHGEAAHNVAAANHVDPAGAEFLDARLTDAGRAQVRAANREFGELLERTPYPRPECIFASPLHRTLETASILAKGHVARPIVAVDALRERRGGNPCDERHAADAIRREFAHVDASRVAADDAASPDGYALRPGLVEDDGAVAARARVVDWVRTLDEASVLLVAHRFFLKAMIDGVLRPALDAAGGALEAVFRASEVRVLEVSWDAAGRLVSVVARSLGDAIREADRRTLAAFEDARRAIGRVRDDALAARVDELQARALAALFAGAAADADAAFRDLKAIAEAESGRLTALLARVMDAYRLLGERYRFLNRVPAREGAAPAQVLPLPATADAAATGDVARVRLLLARPADAGTALGAAPLRLKFGPPKSLGRALEKPLGSLKDLNRCTVECHCPYVCALFLAGLRETFPVVAVKNKRKPAHKQDEVSQPPDLHVNVDLGGGFLGEVQIILTYWLEVKNILHFFYELLRAKTVDLVLEPMRRHAPETG
ncbi:isomerase [Aureococcus anophagefferens]|nr:isomerase [Aureococcus anophagefferens]